MSGAELLGTLDSMGAWTKEMDIAARVVADMHESGEGFQWVGSEDDTEALDAICAALARLDSGAAE